MHPLAPSLESVPTDTHLHRRHRHEALPRTPLRSSCPSSCSSSFYCRHGHRCAVLWCGCTAVCGGGWCDREGNLGHQRFVRYLLITARLCNSSLLVSAMHAGGCDCKEGECLEDTCSCFEVSRGLARTVACSVSQPISEHSHMTTCTCRFPPSFPPARYSLTYPTTYHVQDRKFCVPGVCGCSDTKCCNTKEKHRAREERNQAAQARQLALARGEIWPPATAESAATAGPAAPTDPATTGPTFTVAGVRKPRSPTK